MSTILDEIVVHKKSEIEFAKSETPLAKLQELCQSVESCPSFLDAIRQAEGVALIAEVKKASPSKGLIRADFEPVEIAKQYGDHGAACISVLTDNKYFQGHLDYLKAIGKAVAKPLLRKDFVVDPYQIYEAKLAGASAVLLIAECLEPNELKELNGLIVELGMIALVEFHDADNLQMCLDSGAELIGVNNRDLRTFHTDLDHVIRLSRDIPTDRLIVAESGIFTKDDVDRIAEANVQAMLVGESLMRQHDIGKAVQNLLGR